MVKYFVFLRGINVGGKNVIKMAELRKALSFAGFSDVRTMIQSGNIVFESPILKSEEIKNITEKTISKSFGHNVCAIVRTESEAYEILKTNPFNDFSDGKDEKYYICFLENKPKITPKLPFSVEKDGLELIKIATNEAFLISRKIKDRYGFPNTFIEKLLKVNSTARYWTTAEKFFKEN
jgi:uncharacterized protein (DUF1697 family)